MYSLIQSFATANKDIQVTGSLDLKFDGVTNYFAITIDGEEKVKVNEEGILQLFAHENAPTPVEGGLFFGNDDSLYLGVND
jgi:outer membrane protein assembly factor BamB